jgi:DNA-binding MarR family transcriptional regulator
MRKNSTVRPAAAPALANPLETLLGYQLRRATQAMLDDLVSELEDFSLRPTSASVLLLVASNPGITQSRIGQVLAIERANMAPITSKLTRQGWLTRSRADGRSHRLQVTEEGKAVVAKIRRRIAIHEGRFWKDTKAADRDAILAFLSSLWKAAV